MPWSEKDLEDKLRENKHLKVKKEKIDWSVRGREEKPAPIFRDETPAPAEVVEPYSRANKTEKAYAVYLDFLKATRQIKDFKFHAIKLFLAESCWYETDFMVINNLNQIEIHETKGFMREDALVKFKVACAMYPFIFKMVKKIPEKDGGGWSVRDGRGGLVNFDKKGE